MEKKERTPAKNRRDIFVREYLVDFNATRACIASGYSAKSANEAASRLLADVRVQEAISKELIKRLGSLEVTGDRVIKEIAEIAFDKKLTPRDRLKAPALLR